MLPKRRAAVTASLAITDAVKRTKKTVSSEANKAVANQIAKTAMKGKSKVTTVKEEKSSSADKDDESEFSGGGDAKNTQMQTRKGKRIDKTDEVDEKEPEIAKKRAKKDETSKEDVKRGKKQTQTKNTTKAVTAKGKGKKVEASDEEEIDTAKGNGKKAAPSKEKGNDKKVETSEESDENFVTLKGKGKKVETSDEEDEQELATAKGNGKKAAPSKEKGNDKKVATSKGKRRNVKTAKGKDKNLESSDDEEPETSKGNAKKRKTSKQKGKKVVAYKEKILDLDSCDEDEKKPKTSSNEPVTLTGSDKLDGSSNVSLKKPNPSDKDDRKPDSDSDTEIGAVGGDDGGSDASKKEEEEREPEIRYEFEESRDNWIVYNEATTNDINAALKNKKKTVIVVVEGIVYVVSFDRMMQVKKGMKSECRFKCCYQDETDKDKSWFSWNYEEGNDWSCFDPRNSSLLEDAHLNKLDKIELKHKRSLQTVDLQKMVIVSKRSKKLVKVSRMKSEAETLTKSKASDRNKAAAAAVKGKANGVKTEPEDVAVIVIKGKAPVDPHCTDMIGKAHVYYDEDEIYDAMLNQTNLQFNNNKFFQLQLLEDDFVHRYSVWFRWGRVGNKGQHSLTDFNGNLIEAKAAFKKKFYDKTNNRWEDRNEFVKVSGKYDIVAMDYSKPSDVVDSGHQEMKPLPKIPESKLDQSVKGLIELICNVKAMEEAVIEMKYDAKKSPLGKLTTEQIKAGYSALKEIDELIASGTKGTMLLHACNEFYTKIPHNFGMKTPPLISTKAEILLKIHLLEALGDIQLALKMLGEVVNDFENPIDSHYKALKCDLKPLDKSSSDFKMINEYLQNTHEATHSMYKMELLDVFVCDRDDETQTFIDHGNRMLLWHGSRLTNWAGILSRGLCIAPPEAPISGYMFGKGVYFADRSSKSANYCCTSANNNIGVLLLCEVSLGSMDEFRLGNYKAENLPRNKHSVKGIGMMTPDESQNRTLLDGTIVPLGSSLRYQGDQNLSLMYNEYVVYNTKQIKMRFLLKVKFIY